MDNISSITLKKCVNEFAKLPGIGRKTALRLSIHLLKQKDDAAKELAQAIIDLKEQIKFCAICNNLSENEICEICSNTKRNSHQICVVENIQDILAIENTQQYQGHYHVLNGVISPMDGIAPSDLNFESLFSRVQPELQVEVILALPTTVEGDTTNFYIYRKLQNKAIKISTLARGVSIGDEIEFIDELTLGRSIINRVPYEG
jgi:recombination protein RecR